VAAAVKKIREESANEHFVIQRFIDGISVSVSLISTGERALPITLNKQLITLASPYGRSGYTGGLVPLRHKLEEKALKAAQTAVESIGGLKGYVGVDMTLTNKEPFIMEINPRLTTSYIGLRRIANFNPAQAVIDAALKGKLPKNQSTRGCVFFSKVKVPPLTRQPLKETYKLKEVVSPPLPIMSDKPACALVAAYSDTPKKAEALFHKARRSLLKLCEKRN
jgi:predicted ATP-grasp superfamily ATP-dependent carboligase